VLTSYAHFLFYFLCILVDWWNWRRSKTWGQTS